MDLPVILPQLKGLIEESFTMPFYIVLGNHDNRYFNTFSGNEIPLGSWVCVFGETQMLPSHYYHFFHKGFNFITLFASDLAYDHDSNDKPSFGEEQLAWLENILAEGKPSILFWHQYIDPVKEAENDSPNPIIPLLGKYSETVLATFSGHNHKFYDIEWEGIHFYETDDLKTGEGLVHHLVRANLFSGCYS